MYWASRVHKLSGSGSSKGVGLPPEVTSRSRDVNKDGGGVNDLTLSPHPLINMQMTQLICKYM